MTVPTPHWMGALAGLALLAIGAPAQAATYTVSASGSDSANGISSPFKTLQKAAQVLRDGDTVVFTAGTYRGGAWIEGLSNVTFRGEGNALIDGTSGTRDDGLNFSEVRNVRVEGLRFRNARRYGVMCVLSQGFTVRDCEASSNGRSGILTGNTSDVLIENVTASQNREEHGVYLSQSGDRLTVRNCTLFNNTRAGLQINAVEGGGSSDPNHDNLSKNCVVEGNTLYANGSAGGSAINLAGVQQSVIVNNLITNNLAGGIAMWDDGAGSSMGCKNNRIYHNTIVFPSGRGRYGVQCINGSTGNTLMNNILVSGSGPCLDTDTAVISNFNCFQGPSVANGGNLAAWQRSSGNDRNSDSGSPGLNGDFRPVAGSPVIDTGTRVWDTDKEGRARPAGANPDVGCFEMNGVPGGGGGGGGGDTPPPTGAASIYTDALASGWTAVRQAAKCNLAATSPVAEGSRSMALTITGADGGVVLTGTGHALSGKMSLVLRIHGGSTGNQQFRVRAVVNGVPVAGSLNLRNYGGLPQKGRWTTLTIPLADLQATTGSLTGLAIFAGKAYSVAYLDDIRVQ